MQKSTEVNDALKTLKDPILRAEAIIALNTGEQIDLEQKKYARCGVFNATVTVARTTRRT